MTCRQAPVPGHGGRFWIPKGLEYSHDRRPPSQITRESWNKVLSPRPNTNLYAPPSRSICWRQSLMSTTSEHLAAEQSRPCLGLASVRKRIGITLEEIAQSTRIAARYLQAIDAEEFAKLPSGVYATSYIRQYARAIGYNETELLDHYRARRQPELPPID